MPVRSLAAGLATCLVALAFASLPASAQVTLVSVKKRGALQCGVNTGLPGFSQADARGEWKGIDVDYCRAVAAAIFGDPTKVRFTPLRAPERFTALQSAEIDVLVRNTTWTLSRETVLGLEFPIVNVFDGESFLVRKNLSVTAVKELDGASICVTAGTTTETNLANHFRSRQIKYEAVAFGSWDDAFNAYDTGRCDALVNDATYLYSQRLRTSRPDDHVVLSAFISKEAMGPAVRKGDGRWADIVRWVHAALLNAEELGVTQANVDGMAASDHPAVRRLLGLEGNFGQALGLDRAWARRVIKAVGNYGEIFERNLGTGSPFQMPRGLNGLWNRGGLHYAPSIPDPSAPIRLAPKPAPGVARPPAAGPPPLAALPPAVAPPPVVAPPPAAAPPEDTTRLAVKEPVGSGATALGAKRPDQTGPAPEPARPAFLPGTRVAVVIGNGAYQHLTRLPNPPNDARDVAEALKRLGFTVTLLVDATRTEMEEGLSGFAREARGADAALAYFAGHGLQHQGHNYLAPVDARLTDEIDLRRRFLRVQDVIEELQAAKGVRMLLLDACRDNEAIQKLASAAPTRGFARTGLAKDRAEGILIAYATQPDKLAEDGVGGGRNSPFTTALLKHLPTPGIDVRILMTRVRGEVLSATGGKQRPELSDSLDGEFAFR